MNASFLSLICFGCFFVSVAAHAGPISKVPVTITKPGKYYLIADVTSTATATSPDSVAIEINADNVELDLQGFTVTANPANGRLTTGIFVAGKEGIRVRNGRVRGFATGVSGGNTSYDVLFDGLEIRGTTYGGFCETKGSHFRNCTFVLDSATGYGLYLSSSGGGPAHIVEFCSFYATSPGVAATQCGVQVGGAPGTIIRNCQFINFGLGISGNNVTSAADNVFQSCVSKYDAGVTNLAGYNQ